jgi:sulfite reductase (ferredoxin)
MMARSTGLRAIIARHQLNVRLTAQQNILLTGILPEQRAAIDEMIVEYGILTVQQISRLRRNAMACPALPTCGLAITEAERIFPQVIDRLEELLDHLNLGDAAITSRMTGCPNGCARPYVAEIALVGRSLDKYTIFLGGNPVGTRLAKPFLDVVPIADLIPVLTPVLAHYRDARTEGETFGDFCMRVGLESLRELVPAQWRTLGAYGA